MTPKISYCVTCYNRYNDIKKTLPKNLKTIRKNNSELILVDFNGQDSKKGILWILKYFSDEIKNKKLKIFKRKNKGFIWASSIAKNIAHRFASGDILVNLDSDNLIRLIDHEKLLSAFRKKTILLFI